MPGALTVRWSNPAGTVDERLLVLPSGEARLVALSPLTEAQRIGEFAGRVSDDKLAMLSSAGEVVAIDTHHGDHGGSDPAVAAVSVLASEVATRCRAHPVAVAHLVLRPTGPVDAGHRPFALGVVGEGERACEFQLDPARCRVLFWSAGDLLGEAPVPPLATGFATPDAEGLGGVGRPAEVRPGVLGAIALELVVPAEATHAEVVLTGSWFAGQAVRSPGAGASATDRLDPQVEGPLQPPERFTGRAVTDLRS